MNDTEAIEQQRQLYKLNNDNRLDDTIRYLINPKEIIREKMFILSGYHYNVERGRWEEPKNKRPLMNDRGLKFALGEFNHILNKLIPQANLSKKEVSAYIMSYSRRVRTSLVTNIYDFGIKNIADLSQIKNIIVDIAYIILTQPIDDKGRKFIFAPLKLVESHSFAEQNTHPRKMKLGW